MARPSRAEIFDPNEVAIAHIYNRTVRRCFLMGDDAAKHQDILAFLFEFTTRETFERASGVYVIPKPYPMHSAAAPSSAQLRSASGDAR
jgi:hypothetical protein